MFEPKAFTLHELTYLLMLYNQTYIFSLPRICLSPFLALGEQRKIFREAQKLMIAIEGTDTVIADCAAIQDPSL